MTLKHYKIQYCKIYKNFQNAKEIHVHYLIAHYTSPVNNKAVRWLEVSQKLT